VEGCQPLFFWDCGLLADMSPGWFSPETLYCGARSPDLQEGRLHCLFAAHEERRQADSRPADCSAFWGNLNQIITTSLPALFAVVLPSKQRVLPGARPTWPGTSPRRASPGPFGQPATRQHCSDAKGGAVSGFWRFTDTLQPEALRVLISLVSGIRRMVDERSSGLFQPVLCCAC
jgi:hypothetical protein